MRTRRGCPLLLLLLAFSLACGSTRVAAPERSILAFGRQGVPVDPVGNVCEAPPADELYCRKGHSSLKKPRVYDAPAYDRHIANVLDAIDASGRKRILIFVHGGLNARGKSIERARILEQRIVAGGEYHPLFVNWRTSLRSTYGDHLFRVRQGKFQKKPVYAWVTSPFVFGSDIANGIVRTPLVWLGQLRNLRRAVSKTSSIEREERAWRELSELHPARFWREESESCKSAGGSGRALKKVLILNPVKLVTSPLLEGVAPSAWKMMGRRAESLFHRDDFLRRQYPPSHPDRRFEGDLYGFLEELTKWIADRNSAPDAGDPYRVTLVGHSMGAIVVNDIVRYFGERLPIERIVFLAAAMSLRDYEDSVIPHLRRQLERKENATDVYHVMLAERSELTEANAFDFVPRGSLLSWLDNYLDDPKTALDRMAGRARNLVRIADIPARDDAIAQQIHMKVYGIPKCHAATQPTRHGDFSLKYKFWDDACVDPASGGAHCPLVGGCDPSEPGKEPCFLGTKKGWKYKGQPAS